MKIDNDHTPLKIVSITLRNGLLSSDETTGSPTTNIALPESSHTRHFILNLYKMSRSVSKK
jgi:hypothetical protein